MKKNDVDVTQGIKALSRSLSESVVSVSLLTRDGGDERDWIYGLLNTNNTIGVVAYWAWDIGIRHVVIEPFFPVQHITKLIRSFDT